jgi:hypothetical protein
MKAFSLLFLFIALVVAGGCKKDNVSSQKLQGNYTGRLVTQGVQSTPGVIDFKVEITGNNYHAFPTTGLLPLSSKGTFALNNNDQIAFTDSLVHTANFNWSLLLSGTYSAEYKGDSLILVKGGDNYSYTYRLKKQ